MTWFDTDNLGKGRAMRVPRRSASFQAEPVPVSGLRPAAAIARVIDDLFAIKTPDVEWLERAGPIARRLNEESKRGQ